jgi:tetratricopeptide (TPR) repeat protein
MSIAQAEFKVHYGLALIYSGETEQGISLLKWVISEVEGTRNPGEVAWQNDPHSIEDRRWNWTLGRAHNNLGYAYWMEQGHYRLALREFRAALPYFHASHLSEEFANTIDNMGRVYALLHQRGLAERLIEAGLELRRALKLDYRVALSLNSRAIAHLMFEEPHEARRLSEEALSICERLGMQRGIGLACVTLGRSLRQLGSTDSSCPHRERVEFLAQAIGHLDRAVGIFERVVEEPVRLIEAYKELGCAYRDLAGLAYSDDLNPSLAERFGRRAMHCLLEAICVAEGKNAALYVDCCIELPQTFLQAQHFSEADSWLKHIEQKIPDAYRAQADSELGDVPVEQCVERFWCLLGKVELLRGYLTFSYGLSIGRERFDALVDATHHWALATIYFYRYSGWILDLETTNLQKIRSRPVLRGPDSVRYLRNKALPISAEIPDINISDLCDVLNEMRCRAAEMNCQ